MCGILGFISNKNQNLGDHMYRCMLNLQHRGQDACGISTINVVKKAKGLVRDVFNANHLKLFHNNMAIGHLRYATYNSSSSQSDCIQPFRIDNILNISICHNGNITNISTVQDELRKHKVLLSTTSDSHMILQLFFAKLLEKYDFINMNILDEYIISTSEEMMNILEGSYSLIFMIENYGIVTLRDSFGIRPLVYGSIIDNGIDMYCIASESCAISELTTKCLDVPHGSVGLFKISNTFPIFHILTQKLLSPCLFEYIYFSRSDSIINKVSVYQTQYEMGQCLAMQILKKEYCSKIEMIVPVPNSGLIFALGVASILSIPLHIAILRNKDTERTFIMVNKEAIYQSVQNKLSIIPHIIQDKNILFVDDSIVRGNTSKYIVQSAKQYAKTIYFASGAPKITHSNHYGIYIPTELELISYNRDDDKIASILDCDGVIFNDLSHVKNVIQNYNPSIKSFESTMFGDNTLYS